MILLRRGLMFPLIGYWRSGPQEARDKMRVTTHAHCDADTALPRSTTTSMDGHCEGAEIW